MFSKSEGAGLMVQEDERYLSNVVLEGRSTNPDGRRKQQKKETNKSKSVQGVQSVQVHFKQPIDQEENVLSQN